MDLTILLVTRDRPVLLEHSIRSILASAAKESAATGWVKAMRPICESREKGRRNLIDAMSHSP